MFIVFTDQDQLDKNYRKTGAPPLKAFKEYPLVSLTPAPNCSKGSLIAVAPPPNELQVMLGGISFYVVSAISYPMWHSFLNIPDRHPMDLVELKFNIETIQKTRKSDLLQRLEAAREEVVRVANEAGYNVEVEIKQSTLVARKV